MKFIVSTTTLLKALQTVSGVIKNGSSVLPILEDFLFELSKGILTVSATDLDTSLSTSIRVEAKEDLRIAIPAKILIDTLKTLPEQPLVFKVDEKSLAVEITTETGRYKLTGENAEDFPKFPQAESVTEMHIPATALSRAISKTLFAVSNDELRPAMSGVLFELTPEGMAFVSTDAHTLVKVVRSEIKTAKPIQFIVPKKASALLKSLLPTDDVAVNVSYNKSNAFFAFGSTKLICRLIDANYPDYNAVIPQNNPIKVSVSRLELHNAMKRMQLYSNASTYQAVMTVSGSEMKVSAVDLDFNKEAYERVTCSSDGGDIEIGFNAKLLIDLLSAFDSSDIEINLSTPTRAAVFCPVEKEDNEELLILLMPVMVNA